MKENIRNISVEIKYQTPAMGSSGKSSTRNLPAHLTAHEKAKKVILGSIADLTRLAVLEGYGADAVLQVKMTKGQTESFLSKEKTDDRE